MADQIPNAFPRRLNDDETYDLICPRCFRTVVRKTHESQLTEIERKHVCGSAGDWDANFGDDPPPSFAI
jgi:hypothetical protein